MTDSHDNTRQTELSPSSMEPWEQHAAWAIALAHALTAEASRLPRHALERMLEAIATRFECAARVIVTPSRIENADPPSIERSSAADLTEASSGPTFVDELSLADGRRARLTLQRPAGSPPFRPVELRWISIVHAGCAWVYAPAEQGKGPRMSQLSPREREALGHLLRGASEKEIAAALGRSRHTVHSYVKRIYRALGVRSRSELRAIFRDANGSQAQPNAGTDGFTTSTG